MDQGGGEHALNGPQRAPADWRRGSNKYLQTGAVAAWRATELSSWAITMRTSGHKFDVQSAGAEWQQTIAVRQAGVHVPPHVHTCPLRSCG